MENLQLSYRIFRTVDLEPEKIKTLALRAVIRLLLLPFGVQQWSCFYSFQGLVGLCYIKNPK